ncbi:MAG TPA: cytochrome c [Oceanithermus profundus]|uniref:Cytochrome c n=1 Tax=Oceanithermus profundus TaxID=187137 RepID=A0A7C4ZH62_9DEIN|nr:cytochrome c [Oceanithermus profundus]
MDIVRVEAFLDDASEPLVVVTEPPFNVRLDPAQLGEGEHVLTVVTHYASGASDHHEYVFDVSHSDRVFAGHVSRAPLRAPVEVELVDAVEREEPKAPSMNLYGLLPLALFLLVVVVSWYIAVRAESATVDQPTNVQKIARSVAAAAPTAKAGAADGAGLYAANCASCHGANGEGMGAVFPALAGNDRLADADYVIRTVLNGKPGTAMPGFGARFSDEEVAAVVSYVRTGWGNGYGAVDAAQVAAAR